MDLIASIVHAAVDTGGDGPNLWGALGCVVAYAAALMAALDGLADYLAPGGMGATGADPAMRLRAMSKIAAAAMTVIAAGLVLILDGNWATVIAVSLGFSAVVIWSTRVFRRQSSREPGSTAAS